MEISDGVHLIAVPTPFPVGPVNCYLIEGDPLTIIDTGVKTSLAIQQLENGLRDAGYGIKQVKQICLTHGHVDHVGLANWIIEQSAHQVDVWIHEIDSERILDYEGYIEDRMHAYHRIAQDSGAPVAKGLLASQRTLADYFLRFGESVSDVRFIEDRAKIPTGLGQLEAVWVPGHSLGSVSYVLDAKELIFSGDHVLGNISSNPSLDFDGVMGISILNYFDSLEKIRVYDGYGVLPGHREMIAELGKRIDDLLDDYKNKMRLIENTLSADPISIYDLSRRIYGDYDASQLVLALAETQDLVKVLEKDGKAQLYKKEDVLVAKK